MQLLEEEINNLKELEKENQIKIHFYIKKIYQLFDNGNESHIKKIMSLDEVKNHIDTKYSYIHSFSFSETSGMGGNLKTSVFNINYNNDTNPKIMFKVSSDYVENYQVKGYSNIISNIQKFSQTIQNSIVKLTSIMNDSKKIKIEIEKIKNNNLNKTISQELSKNTILVGAANSGKNKWIIDNIKEYNYKILSFDNIEQNWKNHLFKKDFSGNYHIGLIFKYIISATFNFNSPYFITSMEIGSYDLRNILGNTLKDILKIEQRLKKEEIEYLFKRLNVDKNLEYITIEEYIKIGNEIEKLYPYKVTSFQVGDYNVPLWLPDNLYFLFAANNNEELEESLEIENKSWSNYGGRFNIIGFNNSLLDKESIFRIKHNNENNEEDNLDKIETFNKEVIKILEKNIDVENIFDITNYLISNFSKIGNNVNKMKNHVIEEIKNNLDEDDYDYENIINNIKSININDN